MTYKSKSISYDARIRIFWSLIAVGVVFLGLYIYAVSTTALNTASRKSLEEERGILATKISEMEFKYITMKNNVSIEVAYQHGFKEVTAPIYVSRTTSNSLSINR